MKSFTEFLNEAKLSKEQTSALNDIGLDRHNSTDHGIKGDDSFWIAYGKQKGKWHTIDSQNNGRQNLSKSELDSFLADEFGE